MKFSKNINYKNYCLVSDEVVATDQEMVDDDENLTQNEGKPLNFMKINLY